MLESPAFRALSLSAHRVLARIEIELAHHGGTGNGTLPATFGDFERYGIGDRHAIAAAIRECEALGFIEITERGRAGNREFRRPNLFRLTYRHLDRAEPTHEWRRIATVEQANEIARAARKSPARTRPKKQNSSGGKTQVSVGETHTENPNPLVGETPTTVMVGKPPLLSISRDRVSARPAGGGAPSKAPGLGVLPGGGGRGGKNTTSLAPPRRR
jgi:hypothetical protein